ncbi:MAG: HRDC domain-containing protein [Pirellulales bacterium]|nr:HRDC domain-containing protein [Pirellulales bacterium]
MSEHIIKTDRELTRFLERLSQAPAIAFDTEFVSEHTYRPVLCLIQVSTGDELAVIDPLPLGNVVSFWQVIAAAGHETIVHAGREEVCFCLDAVGSPPTDLFDVQLAAGLVGHEYPAGYGTLVSRVLGKQVHKRETRTDWRRRPLSSHQIQYALDDVRDLTAVRDILYTELARLGRLTWLADEMKQWLEDVQESRGRERWWRVTGTANLSSRDLALVREVWRWREDEARRRDCSARRILRDDLIVELAKRRATDERQIRAVRGLERRDLQPALAELSQAIARGLGLPDEDCPRAKRRDSNSHLSLVAQFLSSALTSICRSARVATSIVGTAQDVRDLVSWRLSAETGREDAELPVLARGWRAEVVGQLLDDLLAGKTAIRIRDPRSDEPLAFES